MSALFRLLALLASVPLVCAGCDHRHSSPTAPVDASLGLQPVLDVAGDTAIVEIGASTQLSARIRTADGALLDVTAEAIWRVLSGPIAEAGAPGRYRALSWGFARIEVGHPSVSTSASLRIRVAPASAYLTVGLVSSSTGSSLEGILIAAESSAGSFSVRTDENGAFALPARGATTLRIEEDEYEMLLQHLDVGGDSDFPELLVLERRGENGPLSGRYLVTITASRSCTLPSPAMYRAFEAEVDETEDGLLTVETLSDDSFVAWGGRTGFTGVRVGNEVTFVLRDSFDDGYNLIERIPGVGDLYFSGEAAGRVEGGGVRAQLSGTLKVAHGACSAPDHRLEMSRVGGS